jgi:DNA-binding response OmpR family regulator
MKILIIEDQEETINILKLELEEKGFTVDIALDGEKGSFMARTNDYDLIILDNGLPKKDGKTVCQEIRLDGKITPIIMLSVRSDIETKVDLLNFGADDYLTKPFSFKELLARINAILRRPKSISEDLFMVDDLILNSKSNVIKRCDKEIYLTKKEFNLLEYMIKNKGSVLSRSSLLEHVWDINADPFSNTVEAHVASLRKKINTGFDKKLIKTISGRGYKIE